MSITFSFLAYLGICFSILLKWGYSARGQEARSFWIAPHSAGPIVAALAAGASDMSSWLFLAFPGSVYLWGVQDSFLCFGLIIGAYASWTLVAPKLIDLCKKYPKAGSFVQLILSALCFDSSYQKEAAKVLTAIIVFFTCIYIAAGLAAMAKIFSIAFSWNLLFGKVLAAMLLFIAAMTGGAVGLNKLELIQGSSIFCLLLFLALYFGSGDQSALEYSTAPAQQNFSLMHIIHDLSWGLGYIGIPHILMRMSVITLKEDIPSARFTLFMWMTLSLMAALILGLVGQGYFPDIADPEMVVPKFLFLLGPFVTGAGLALMVGACLCAGTAQLYTSSATVSEDLCAFKISRSFSVVLLISLSFVLGFIVKKDIFSLVDLGWAGLTSTFAPHVILLCLGRTVPSKVIAVMAAMNLFAVNVFFVCAPSLEVEVGSLLPAFFLHLSLLSYFSTTQSRKPRLWELK